MTQRLTTRSRSDTNVLRRIYARSGLVPSRWRLTKERIRRHLQQVELAARMDPPIRAETLSRYETGQYDLHLGVATRAAKALECALPALLVDNLAELELEDACRDEWHTLGRPADVDAMELIEASMRSRRNFS